MSALGTSRPISLTLRLSAKGGKPTCAADFEPLDMPQPCGRIPAAWSPPTEAEPRRQWCGPGRLRIAKLCGEHFVILVKAARFATGLLEPVEHLGGRIDLVVMLAVGANRQL